MCQTKVKKLLKKIKFKNSIIEKMRVSAAKKERELQITMGRLARSQGQPCFSDNTYFNIGYKSEKQRQVEEVK